MIWTEKSLIFCDIETMGLALDAPIVEIALVLTDENLVELDHEQRVIPYSHLEWCRSAEGVALHMHKTSGLLAESVMAWESATTTTPELVLHGDKRLPDFDAAILSVLLDWDVPPQQGVLAGSSVHSDRAWIRQQLPRFHDYLHYRMVDVSGIKELVARWLDPKISDRLKTIHQQPTATHRALDDIRATMEELRFYRKHIFDRGLLPPFEPNVKGG